MFRRRCGVLQYVSLVLAASLVGCGPPRIVRIALKGNLVELSREVREASARGELDPELTREAALAVAERVVASSRDPDGASLLDGAGACRRHLVEAYQSRSQRGDASAAAASMALCEDGILAGDDLVRRYQATSDPAWLAVAARAATSPELAGWRNELLRHPDPRVRYGALRAAIAARSAENLLELSAASRLDPDPESRRLAILALGELGTDGALVALQDRWRTGTNTVRLAVVEAWARAPAYDNGGRDALERAALGKGLPAVRATVALIHAENDAPHWTMDVVVRVLLGGSEDEQLMAIPAAEVAHERTAKALLALCDRASDPVRLSAHNALLKSPKHRARARKWLQETARGSGMTALQARARLARAGDLSVVPLLEKQLSSPNARERVSAALSLTALDLPHKAAGALTERNPHDRLDVACAMVASPLVD